MTISSNKRSDHPDRSTIGEEVADALTEQISDTGQVAAVCRNTTGMAKGDRRPNSSFPRANPRQIEDAEGPMGVQFGSLTSQGGRIHVHAKLTITHTGGIRLDPEFLRKQLTQKIQRAGGGSWLKKKNGQMGKLYVNIRFIRNLEEYIEDGMEEHGPSLETNDASVDELAAQFAATDLVSPPSPEL